MPDAGTGAAEATITLADAVLHVDAHQTPGAGELEGTLDAKSLALVQPFVALPAGWQIAWARASARLTTHVQVDALAAAHPRLTHATTIDLSGFEATSPQGPVLMPSLQAVLDAHGTSVAHAGTLTLDCMRCAVGPTKLGQERVVATFDLDRQLPRARVQLDAKGSEGPDLHGVLSAGYVKKEDRTQVAAELTLGRLAALAPLLHGTPGDAFELEKLGVALHARGSLAGKDFSPQTARGSAEAEITGLLWEQGARSLDVPELALTAKLDGSDAGQQLTATARTPRVQAEVAENTATLSGLALALEGQLARGSLAASAKLDLSIKDVAQDFAPAYAVGGVKAAATGGRDATGLLTLARSTVLNEAAGTSLWIEGAMVPDPTHPKARARVELTQDLALAWRDGKQFKGKGQALLKLDLHSADLRGFQTTGSLTLTEADVRVPGAVAEGIQGDLPFAVDFILDAKGLRPVRTAKVNPYALLRFQDQHPLLKAQSFLTMRKLTTPQVTLAPFAANVQVSQSVLYLSQLETGLSGGVITGELMVDMNEKDPRARANVRATGIKSEGGDVFTGNAALAISLREHSVDGRAEVLEISKRQLLILLDMSDPHHTSASTNKHPPGARVRLPRAAAHSLQPRLRQRQGHLRRRGEPGATRRAAGHPRGVAARPLPVHGGRPGGRHMNRVVWLALLAATGCVKMSEIVVTDRVTALEEQAGGSFDELELKLTRAGIAPRPLPLTPDQFGGAGPATPGEVARPRPHPDGPARSLLAAALRGRGPRRAADRDARGL